MGVIYKIIALSRQTLSSVCRDVLFFWGYYLSLMLKNNKLLGIIIELKAEKNCNKDDLKKLAEKTLAQIDENKYD